MLDMLNQPPIVINNMYKIAFERNKEEEKLSDEQKQAKALAELPDMIEEGSII